MATTFSDTILETAAHDGSIDIADWPRALETVLQRLHDIVHSEFPLPTKPLVLPPPVHSAEGEAGSTSTDLPSSTARQAVLQSQDGTEATELASQASSGANKENREPSAPPVATKGAPPTLSETTTEEDPFSAYPYLATSYNASIDALKTSFSEAPPYTVQRLAELVLRPKRHYRFLPPYLAALDRVVSVSSPTSSFPLTHQANGSNAAILTNGEEETNNGLAGDEGLGGALLTPIPWLRKASAEQETSTNQSDGELRTEGTETIEGPNGAGRIETVSVTVNGVPSTTQTSNPLSHGPLHAATEQEMRDQGAVTQGELLRQEQEAGVVPVAQTTARRNQAVSGDSLGVGPVETAEPEGEDEVPHARGPEEIGMEDLGPQVGGLGASRPLDLDAALGRKKEGEAAGEEIVKPGEEAPGAKMMEGEGVGASDLTSGTDDAGAKQDEDGDYVLVDAAEDT